MTTIVFHSHFHSDSRFQFKFSQPRMQLSPVDRECIKKTWFPRDFHSNMCLANREIDFRIATGCRFSNLDTRFSIDRYLFALARCRLPLKYVLLQHDRNILEHRWRQLPICLHSVHNWKQFAICSRHRLQLLTHFVRRPSICWVNTPIEIMELESNKT